MALIGSISEYKEGKEDFESYLERLEQWMAANTVADEKKVSVFLSIIGADAYKLLKSLLLPDKPSTKSYAQLTKALSDHYKPKPLVIMERFRFQKRNQQESESVSDFIVALKQLSTNCDFGAHLDDALRDRFVSGLRSEAIQRKLLAETNVTFKSACDTALSMEMASRNTLEFSGKIKESGTVNRVYNQNKKRDDKRNSSNTSYGKSTTWQKSSVDEKQQQPHQPCYRCGGKHPATVCRFKQEKCHHCTKVGHIARM